MVPFFLMRNGKRMTVTATVGKRPSEDELAQQQFNPNTPQQSDPYAQGENQGESLAAKSLGLSVIPLTAQIAGQLGVPATTRGLVVAQVDPSSDAASRGFSRGDIILSANYRDVATLADLETAIRTAKTENRAALLLRVQKRGQPAVYVPVRLR